jgi:hypothetical protein
MLIPTRGQVRPSDSCVSLRLPVGEGNPDPSVDGAFENVDPQYSNHLGLPPNLASFCAIPGCILGCAILGQLLSTQRLA